MHTRERTHLGLLMLLQARYPVCRQQGAANLYIAIAQLVAARVIEHHLRSKRVKRTASPSRRHLCNEQATAVPSRLQLFLVEQEDHDQQRQVQLTVSGGGGQDRLHP